MLLASGQVSAALTAPNGTVTSSLPDGPLDPAEPFRTFTAITAPASGTWTLDLTNDGSTSSAAYSVWETGETGTLDVSARDLGDGTARVSASISDGAVPATGEDVRATVRALDGTTQMLVLHDDGLHGDGAASDGTYAERAPLSPSEYLVTVRAAGTLGRTVFQRLVMVAPSAVAGSSSPPAGNPVSAQPSQPPTVAPAHRGVPALTRPGGAFAPPLVASVRGRVLRIASTVTVDEAVALRVSLATRKHILAGSVLAGARSGRDHVELAHVLETGSRVSFSLLFRARDIGRGGTIVVVAMAQDGQQTTLRIPFRR
jgi:hypothetical protein